MRVDQNLPYLPVPALESRPEAETRLAAAGAAPLLDATLHLDGGPRDILGGYHALGADEPQAYLRMLADMIRLGVTGTESLEVRGERYRSFVDTRMADPYYRDARPYRSGNRFDMRG